MYIVSREHLSVHDLSGLCYKDVMPLLQTNYHIIDFKCYILLSYISVN
jgi:hypothetical protein